MTETEELHRWRRGLESALAAPPKRRRTLRTLTIGLVIVAVVGVAGGYYYWHAIAGLFKRANLALDPAAGGALNVLLVGSDSRVGLDSPEDVNRFGRVGGQRSDTLIVVQVVPAQRRGVMLSIPRDLWVTIRHDGRETRGKINGAYQYGPQAVIDTVGGLTGIPINHYIEVNFGGFRKMVDAIGGIDVCNAQSFTDRIIGFSLTSGMHHLDGQDALSYVRTRHATANGDFGRIQRQQEFIRAVMAKIGTPSVLGNPVRVNQLATSFAQNVTVDQYFELNDLLRLAVSIRNVGADQLLTYSVPGRVGRIGAQSVVLLEAEKAETLFRAMRDVTDPSDVVSPQSQAAAATRATLGGPGVFAAQPACAAGAT